MNAEDTLLHLLNTFILNKGTDPTEIVMCPAMWETITKEVTPDDQVIVTKEGSLKFWGTPVTLDESVSKYQYIIR